MGRRIIFVYYFFAITLLPISCMGASVTGTGGGGSAQGLGPNFNLTGGNTISGANESKKLEIRGTGGQATSGVNIYQHSSGVLIIKPVVGGVEGEADIYPQLNSGKKWGLKDSGGNIDFEYDESTGKIDVLTTNAEDSGVNLTLYQRLCGGDLVAVDPATGTASHIWNKSPLGSSPTATAVIGTNRAMGVATFPDSDGDYGLQLTCVLPPGFTGNIDAVIWWKTTGTGNARFQVQTKCYADDEADDAAFNTASIVTAAAGTSGRPNRQAITGITATGCAADEMIRFRLFRNRTEASDSLNAALDIEKVDFWVRNIY